MVPPRTAVSSGESSESDGQLENESTSEGTINADELNTGFTTGDNKRKRQAKHRQVSKTHERHKRRQMIRAQLSDENEVPFLARGKYVIEKKHYFNQNHAKVNEEDSTEYFRCLTLRLFRSCAQLFTSRQLLHCSLLDLQRACSACTSCQILQISTLSAFRKSASQRWL